MNRFRKNNLGTKTNGAVPIGTLPAKSMMEQSKNFMTSGASNFGVASHHNNNNNTNNNNNMGFLSGANEIGHGRTARRQQRIQNFKTMPSVITPTNIGMKGTMIQANNTFEITPQNNMNYSVTNAGSNLAAQINVPTDVKDKLNRWREERQKRQQMEQSTFQEPRVLVDATNTTLANVSSIPSVTSTSSTVTFNHHNNHQTPMIDEQENDDEIGHQQIDGYHEFKSSGGKLPNDLNLGPIRHGVSPSSEEWENKNELPSASTLPSSSSLSPSLLPSSSGNMVNSSPTPLQNLFDTTGQEILKGMVETEVKKILDLLKKERPELVSQNDLVNQINQKHRKVEDLLQQFNIHNQRLKETVDQLVVSVKAVQSNIDHVKHERGGSGVTEEVMRSWVVHFFTEQIGNLKKDFQEEFFKMNEKINSLAGGNVGAISSKTSERLGVVENNIKLLETKFHNTLQNIFETVCFVYGTTVDKIPVYSLQSPNASVITTIGAGEDILLIYPILSDENNNKWMKTRIVDHETAQLADGYVTLLWNQEIMINNFRL